jgi:ABC-type polysaccharide/polyol phosphate export permease
MIASFLIWIFEMFSQTYLENKVITLYSLVDIWLIMGIGLMIFHFILKRNETKV